MREGDGVVGVWAHRHALLSCPHCCVVVPCCRHVVVVHRSRMWLSHTINGDEQRPLSSFVIWLAHSPLSCSLSSIVVWWLSCRGVVCRGCVSALSGDHCGVVFVFIKYTTMTNDDRGHCSSFGCHVAWWRRGTKFWC